MSVRSILFNAALKRFVKPSMASVPPERLAASTRENLDAAVSRMPQPPARVRTEPVEARGVPAEWLSTDRSDPSRALLYLHGGSYVGGSPASHRNLTWRLADAGECRVLSLDYRLAPEHPYPAGLNDALAAHTWLEEQADVKRVAWAGDSAGGGLMLAALSAAGSRGLPRPCCTVALSPWCDLAGRGASWSDNAARDPWLSPETLHAAAAMYLNGQAATDPGPSAAYATFEEPPPTLIQVGESEVLLDDARTAAQRLREGGAHVDLQVWNDVPHVWPMFAPMLPESAEAIKRIGRFLRANW